MTARRRLQAARAVSAAALLLPGVLACGQPRTASADPPAAADAEKVAGRVEVFDLSDLSDNRRRAVLATAKAAGAVATWTDATSPRELVVKGTPDHHAQVDAFVNSLRSLRVHSIASAAVTARAAAAAEPARKPPEKAAAGNGAAVRAFRKETSPKEAKAKTIAPAKEESKKTPKASANAALRSLTPVEDRITATLAKTSNFEYIDEEIGIALEYMARLHNIPILVDDAGLEAAGVDRDQEFTLVLSDARVSDALTNILALQVGGLDYAVRDGVLWVTSQEAAGRILLTRTYAVPAAAAGDPKTPIEELITRHLGAGVSTRGPVRWGDVRRPVRNGYPAKPGHVRLGQVPPDTAAEQPIGGRVSRLGNRLVVTQSDRGHEAVARFLSVLDGADAASEEPESP